MFRNLQETIKSLNADVNNVVNCEKAKKLRKTLLWIGVPLAILGFLGVIICFTLFATAGFGALSSGGFSPAVLVPLILFVPCGMIGGIGSMITALGLRIVVTGYTTDLFNDIVGNNCPNCGHTFTRETYFCPKCGKKIRKECPQCNYVNSYKSEYCEKCGKKLD